MATYWHETYPGDFDPYYVEVLKVCNKRIKFRKENGDEYYRAPGMFDDRKATREEWDEVTKGRFKRPVS